MDDTRPNPEPDEPVDEKQASKLSGYSVHTLRKLRRSGAGGPLFLKLSPGRRGAVRYLPSDIRAWLARKVVANTSEAGDGQ